MEEYPDDIQAYLPPPSPDFNGFDDDTPIPGKLVVETEGEGDEELVVKVWRETGKIAHDMNHNFLKSRDMLPPSSPQVCATSSSRGPGPAPSPSPVPPSPSCPPSQSLGAIPKLPGIGSSSRSKVYLLGSLDPLQVFQAAKFKDCPQCLPFPPPRI